MLLITLAILALSPCDPHHTAHCDVLEINTYCDSHGREVLKQCIFWQWSPSVCDYRVSAWCMWSSVKSSRGNVILMEREGDTWLVSGKQVRITRTTYDPEVRDRELLNSEDRLSLFDLSFPVVTNEGEQ